MVFECATPPFFDEVILTKHYRLLAIIAAMTRQENWTKREQQAVSDTINVDAGIAYLRGRRVSSFFRSYWDAFQKRRQRQKLRASLSDLSDWELMDIGTTRGEIDCVASNRGIDPRGFRSGMIL